MADQRMSHIQTHRSNNIRIGPISVITLITIICMAVMAVLAASTSHATSVISERQATASQQMYLNECAGQEFIAGVDDALADVRASGGSTASASRAVDNRLDAICEDARAAADGQVTCTANVDGTTITAQFVCGQARLLNVAVTILDDATYRVDRWKMSSVQQEAPSSGTLWLGT